MDMLAQLGLSAEQAASGAEALAAIRNSDGLAIVIADIGLPDMDGHHLVREIRQLRPRLKFVMASGKLPDFTDGEGIDGEHIIHLGKPYQLADLKRALERLMA